MRMRWVASGVVGGNTKVVSGSRVQRAMACIAASFSPVASRTTASGLPAPGRSANTSTWTKGRWAMAASGDSGRPRLPVHRSADHRVHRPAHPDLALSVDLQLQARIAADLAALAGQVAAIAPGQAPGAV